MEVSVRRKLSDNLKRVRERMVAACDRAGRQPDEVRLVAVTKTVEVDVIRSAVESGLLDLGESRVQELVRRAGMIREHLGRRRTMDRDGVPPDPRWHMIGHLQRNKVRALLPWVDTLHSLDSLRLAEEVSSEASRLGRTVPVLIEVNVSGEKAKYGIAVGAAPHLAENIRTLPGLSVAGLMTMAPLVDDPEATRPVFSALRRLAGEHGLPRLSMGMTNDFEVAVEEGATDVRIGTALFK